MVWNIDRLKELAGLQEKIYVKKANDGLITESFNVPKSIWELSSDKLQTGLESLREQLRTIPRHSDSYITVSNKIKEFESALSQALKRENQITETVKKIDGKWALVSSEGKPLRYYKGKGKPSENWIKKQERSIQYFKNINENYDEFMKNSELQYPIDWATQDFEQYTNLLDIEGLEYANEYFKNKMVPAAKQEFDLEEYSRYKDHLNSLLNGINSTVLVENNFKKSEDKMDTNNLNSGKIQDEKTKVKVPSKIASQIQKRIKEIEKSKDQFDNVKFLEQTSAKDKAIDCLNHIMELISDCNMKKFKELNIYFSGLSSNITNLFPASLIDFIHLGEENVPIYEPKDTSLYPQIPKSKETPD